MTENTTTIAPKNTSIEFGTVPYFSQRDRAYVKGDKRLVPFLKYQVNIDEFSKVFRDKNHDKTDRALLTSVLRKQYNEIDGLDERRLQQINQLNNENTYTIITAHQPCLFTGPLYVIYKIISAINAAERLNAIYPDRKVVPVYIIGGEDHDFEEINNTYVFNRHLSWKDENPGGAVGRMSTELMNTVLNELKDVCGTDERAISWYNLMEDAYMNSPNYGIASRKIIHALFKDTNLLILSMDEKDFKKSFSEFISKEVLKQFSAPYVRKTQEDLKEAGFEEQAYVREINFFYMNEAGRNRIELDGDIFIIIDTELEFTYSEMAEEIRKHPERFSPNVVMRPIYQEFILPNIAYIGGGGELAYWMERKGQFEAFGLNFPMLIRRNSLILLDKRADKDLDAFNLTVNDLFTDIEALVKDYTREHSNGEISLSTYKKEINKVFQGITEQAQSVDKSLRKFVKSQEVDVMKTLNHIEGKLMKAEKDRLSIEINKLRGLKDRIFPQNGLQERQDNFLSWVIRYDEIFWEKLFAEIDVFDPSVRIVRFS